MMRRLLLAGVAVVGCAVLADLWQAEAWPVQAAAPAAGKAQFAILLGVGDEEPTRWDGSIRARGARVVGLAGWRLADDDSLEGEAWKLSSRRVNMTRGARNRAANAPVLENGVYVTAEIHDASASFEVDTAQGKFTFAANQAKWGETLEFLAGRVKLERVPVTTQLTDSIEEQDFPALAAAGDKAYLAYVEFTHGDRSAKWPRQLGAKPDSYEGLRRPAGGDQVLLMEYSASSGAWSQPQPVSDTGQDVYKTAVAVDGDGGVWVIWSARVKGNFDIYARRRTGGKWSKTLRLTKDAGPDLSPVAATDSEGAVWVGWQGYRASFDILVARQQRNSFSAEQRVSTSPASDWAPHIAAGTGGEVAIVWDTYDKGDYDVYLRRMRFNRGIKMEDPVPVAASRKFEARASVAYGAGNRVWVAYEETYPGWGKDFGAYETTGTGLYQGNTVRVKLLEGNNYFRTTDSLDAVLERRAATQPLNRRRPPAQQRIARTQQPDPELARNRRANTTPYPRGYASKGYPRLAATPDGAVFLAYRSLAGNVWGPLGTTWHENVVCFDGAGWTGPIYAAYSDAILDIRPAMAVVNGSRLLMVSATDHRFSKAGQARRSGSRDLFNYDLMAYELAVEGAPQQPRLTALEAATPAAPMGDVAPEKAQVAMMRNYRTTLDTAQGSEKLQLLRGEFHRHTSVSGDGGNDGDIIDAWRYLLDASYMDWAGCCDHDNGGGREYTWWLAQKMTDAFLVAGKFTPMFSYERSVRYPEGHRNVIFAERGIRSLPRLPRTADDSPPSPAPDTQMLYEYLRAFDGIAAVHTSGTNMGTDWRDNDPKVEPVVEIYQGDRQNYEMPGAPRTNTDKDSIGGWRPLGFVSNALEKGYRLGFQASSDHLSTHMSYCNLWVTEPTRAGILEAFKKRRVYGATDNILADVRCAGHFMGEEFSLTEAPKIDVKLVGSDAFAKVHIIKDNAYAYTIEPGAREVEFSWRDANVEKGRTSYYYVRGEQADGEIVWVSPMWITVN